jgi:hypothetical protein
MDNLRQMLERWTGSTKLEKLELRKEILNAIHDTEDLLLEARYLIKYFDSQNCITENVSKKYQNDFHREIFYRYPLLKFLFITDSPNIEIFQAIEGTARLIEDRLFLLDFARGSSGMPRWNWNVRFASNYLKKCGLIETISYEKNKGKVRKWALTYWGVLFYIYAKDQNEILLRNAGWEGYNSLYERFCCFDDEVQGKLVGELIKRNSCDHDAKIIRMIKDADGLYKHRNELNKKDATFENVEAYKRLETDFIMALRTYKKLTSDEKEDFKRVCSIKGAV